MNQNTKYRVPKFNGTIARMAMQCTHPETGTVGDWLFTGENWRDPDSAVSPLFGDCVPLFKWAKENDWNVIGHNHDYVYQREGAHGEQVSSYMAQNHPNVI